MMNCSFVRLAGHGEYSARPLLKTAAVLTIAALSGCANMASQHVMQDEPANCRGSRPTTFTLNVEYTASCPTDVYATDNGCNTPKGKNPEKNVVCLCRSEVEKVRIGWRSVEAGGTGIPVAKDYELLFDPFAGGKPLKSNPQTGEIPPQKLLVDKKIVERPTTNGEPLTFKYTVVDSNSTCPLVDPRIIVGD